MTRRLQGAPPPLGQHWQQLHCRSGEEKACRKREVVSRGGQRPRVRVGVGGGFGGGPDGGFNAEGQVLKRAGSEGWVNRWGWSSSGDFWLFDGYAHAVCQTMSVKQSHNCVCSNDN